jgi:hypothetical protein
MGTESDEKAPVRDESLAFQAPGDNGAPQEYEVEATERYAYDDSRKLGIMGSAFIIINKMIGTGSE